MPPCLGVWRPIPLSQAAGLRRHSGYCMTCQSSHWNAASIANEAMWRRILQLCEGIPCKTLAIAGLEGASPHKR